MTPDDLSSLHARCFPQAKPWAADAFASLLNKPTTLFCRSHFGFALGQIVAPECDLIMIAIAPEHQGQGHGQQLLYKFCTKAQDKGAKQVLMEVDASNNALLAFYQAVGAGVIRKMPSYYSREDGTKTDAVLMKLDLPVVNEPKM